MFNLKNIARFVGLFLTLIFVIYLALPVQDFPVQPTDAVQSLEQADTETPLRRAYFTNFTREEVLKYYQEQLNHSSFLHLPIPTYRLNYPPEDAYQLIRDQTRSTFLEEIVHPFRETLFVNGFKPSVAKDEIWYKGVHYNQKITVRYNPSPFFARITIILSSFFLLWVLVEEWFYSLKKFLEELKK